MCNKTRKKKGGGHTCHKIKSPHEIIKPCQKDEEEKWDKGALGWEEKRNGVTSGNHEERRGEMRLGLAAKTINGAPKNGEREREATRKREAINVKERET